MRQFAGKTRPETSQSPWRFRVTQGTLNLELPIGSNEGATIWRCSNPKLEMKFSVNECTAKLEDHIVVLRADVDLASVVSGFVFSWSAPAGLEWRRFPIRVL